LQTVPPGKGQSKGEFMTRILLLGLDPETVDFLTLHCRQV
jgi:hypothetical protein